MFLKVSDNNEPQNSDEHINFRYSSKGPTKFNKLILML